ncbi:hypothetical protein EJ02DRAFT_452479 [Clathrospora elynae]|uniref:Uncharacterized protein n=1 Tax=Clathrospora elynae TaxID=706981 RepID=A0A6A5SX96_9PLEO|nr:hypothetical protein EJ02DRAFT_452479 [Clathrospora elynae]
MKTKITLSLFSLLSLTTATPLAKRDSEYIMPKPIIVLLIMLGAGLLVCMGFAIHATFGFKNDGNGFKPMSPEQMEYMAEVRVRSVSHLMHEGARSQRHGGKNSGETSYS